MTEWEEFTAYAGIIADAKREEADRIMQIIDKETFHYGKTHYEGINCAVCRIALAIKGEPNES